MSYRDNVPTFATNTNTTDNPTYIESSPITTDSCRTIEEEIYYAQLNNDIVSFSLGDVNTRGVLLPIGELRYLVVTNNSGRKLKIAHVTTFAFRDSVIDGISEILFNYVTAIPVAPQPLAIPVHITQRGNSADDIINTIGVEYALTVSNETKRSLLNNFKIQYFSTAQSETDESNKKERTTPISPIILPNGAQTMIEISNTAVPPSDGIDSSVSIAFGGYFWDA